MSLVVQSELLCLPVNCDQSARERGWQRSAPGSLLTTGCSVTVGLLARPHLTLTMYIPAAQMGEYDSWKPPPQKRMSSKQILDAKYGGGASVERQSSSGRFSGVERTGSRGRLESPAGGGGSLARWTNILSCQSTSALAIEIIIQLIKFYSSAQDWPA